MVHLHSSAAGDAVVDAAVLLLLRLCQGLFQPFRSDFIEDMNIKTEKTQILRANLFEIQRLRDTLARKWTKNNLPHLNIASNQLRKQLVTEIP